MIVHKSMYEEDGWISVNKSLPPKGVWVDIGVNIVDWNIESVEFTCKGRVGPHGMWVRRKNDVPLKPGQIITHWKFSKDL